MVSQCAAMLCRGGATQHVPTPPPPRSGRHTGGASASGAPPATAPSSASPWRVASLGAIDLSPVSAGDPPPLAVSDPAPPQRTVRQNPSARGASGGGRALGGDDVSPARHVCSAACYEVAGHTSGSATGDRTAGAAVHGAVGGGSSWGGAGGAGGGGDVSDATRQEISRRARERHINYHLSRGDSPPPYDSSEERERINRMTPAWAALRVLADPERAARWGQMSPSQQDARRAIWDAQAAAWELGARLPVKDWKYASDRDSKYQAMTPEQKAAMHAVWAAYDVGEDLELDSSSDEYFSDASWGDSYDDHDWDDSHEGYEDGYEDGEVMTPRTVRAHVQQFMREGGNDIVGEFTGALPLKP